jgi:hypothetical protein
MLSTVFLSRLGWVASATNPLSERRALPSMESMNSSIAEGFLLSIPEAIKPTAAAAPIDR